MNDHPETNEIRLRRLKMRSWRRGMKEMDLILGHFSDGPLRDLNEADLAVYDALLAENDQDLYLWVTRRVTRADHPDRGPQRFSDLLDRIATHAACRQAGL